MLEGTQGPLRPRRRTSRPKLRSSKRKRPRRKSSATTCSSKECVGAQSELTSREGRSFRRLAATPELRIHRSSLSLRECTQYRSQREFQSSDASLHTQPTALDVWRLHLTLNHLARLSVRANRTKSTPSGRSPRRSWRTRRLSSETRSARWRSSKRGIRRVVRAILHAVKTMSAASLSSLSPSARICRHRLTGLGTPAPHHPAQVELKVYKQKVKHLLYEHQNNITALKARFPDTTCAVSEFPPFGTREPTVTCPSTAGGRGEGAEDAARGLPPQRNGAAVRTRAVSSFAACMMSRLVWLFCPVPHRVLLSPSPPPPRSKEKRALKQEIKEMELAHQEARARSPASARPFGQPPRARSPPRPAHQTTHPHPHRRRSCASSRSTRPRSSRSSARSSTRRPRTCSRSTRRRCATSGCGQTPLRLHQLRLAARVVSTYRLIVFSPWRRRR